MAKDDSRSGYPIDPRPKDEYELDIDDIDSAGTELAAIRKRDSRSGYDTTGVGKKNTRAQHIGYSWNTAVSLLFVGLISIAILADRA
ncbi:hypothetical protein F5Y16DRAFT_402662 [Xylariaceae sp. FL0255]|nr:hypothetical protein F5Y16DRAFT_402662 [Xylariaceae sp. FL0255]